jgi:hypothetical protein
MLGTCWQGRMCAPTRHHYLGPKAAWRVCMVLHRPPADEVTRITDTERDNSGLFDRNEENQKLTQQEIEELKKQGKVGCLWQLLVLRKPTHEWALTPSTATARDAGRGRHRGGPVQQQRDLPGASSPVPCAPS